jgi:hypothetical protein
VDEDPLPSYFSSAEPKKVFSYFENGLQRVFVIASQAGDNIYKNSYDGSTVVAGTVPLGNQQLQEASPQNDYCFDRSMTSSNPMGDSNNPYNCEAPAFSYAPAIKSSVTVGGVDVGFKHDIKSLNPETFKYLFTIP